MLFEWHFGHPILELLLLNVLLGETPHLSLGENSLFFDLEVGIFPGLDFLPQGIIQVRTRIPMRIPTMINNIASMVST